jgi:hypothetical protein
MLATIILQQAKRLLPERSTAAEKAVNKSEMQNVNHLSSSRCVSVS